MATLDLTRRTLVFWRGSSTITSPFIKVIRIESTAAALPRGCATATAEVCLKSFHSIIGYFLNATILLRLQTNSPSVSPSQPALLRNTAPYRGGLETAVNHTRAENKWVSSVSCVNTFYSKCKVWTLAQNLALIVNNVSFKKNLYILINLYIT